MKGPGTTKCMGFTFLLDWTRGDTPGRESVVCRHSMHRIRVSAELLLNDSQSRCSCPPTASRYCY